jgi:CelD/BcsL family acetyltransferase involved in cellulose biosynthesis
MGAIEVHRISGREAVYEHAQFLLRLKSDQVHAAGGRNNLASLRHREVLARFAAEHPDRSRVYAMTQNGAPIALAYRIENGMHPILYQMAYSPGPSARHSPGRLLLNRVMEDAVAEHRKVLDFAVGDEPYKLGLCDVVTPMTTSLAAHTPWGRPAIWAEQATLAIKRMVKTRQGRVGAH